MNSKALKKHLIDSGFVIIRKNPAASEIDTVDNKTLAWRVLGTFSNDYQRDEILETMLESDKVIEFDHERPKG